MNSNVHINSCRTTSIIISRRFKHGLEIKVVFLIGKMVSIIFFVFKNVKVQMNMFVILIYFIPKKLNSFCYLERILLLKRFIECAIPKINF